MDTDTRPEGTSGLPFITYHLSLSVVDNRLSIIHNQPSVKGPATAPRGRRGNARGPLEIGNDRKMVPDANGMKLSDLSVEAQAFSRQKTRFGRGVMPYLHGIRTRRPFVPGEDGQSPEGRYQGPVLRQRAFGISE